MVVDSIIMHNEVNISTFGFVDGEHTAITAVIGDAILVDDFLQ